MANNLTGNPMIVDTAAVIKTTPLYVIRMTWTPTTGGDDLLVSDNAGNTVWSLKAIAADANQGIEYVKELGHSLSGINVETIDNGTLYIHVR